ncbi:hypothetical protein GRI34_12545 [Erythrobacter aquimaris]|uniref:DUF4386 family protein n=1 Tax=Qipengyuania aquimaris TaxID=255984 RepID=A0A6I4TN38_9SPHN|nr:hypothetical protein [Qipengyuania aquimaris]MXO97246.1 hypothetical protein [Qipengyuania aquimaris]
MDGNTSPLASLLKVAALASLASAITTATLIYGPDAAPAEGLEVQARLSGDWSYLYKPWVLFFHPQFAFVAALGAAAVLWRARPALVAIGLFYLALWATTEMTQQAYIIDALNQFWRPGYLGAENAAERAGYETLLTGFRAISDSQYFVLLFGFGMGSVLLGAAFLSSDALGKGVGVVTLFLGVVSLAAFAGYYFGPAAGVTGVTGWIYANLYGPLQTGVRLALAWWLWRQAMRHRGAS